MPIKRRYVIDVLESAMSVATEKQAEALQKMLAMNWRVTSVFTRNGKSAICLVTKNNNAWLLPDGKLVRPKPGQERAELDIKLLS